jgi:hypothetical protein
MAEKSILDARLAEIDRRLRAIQNGLAPATHPRAAEPRDPEPVVPPEAAPVPKRLTEAPTDSEAASLIAQLRTLLDAHERLLASAEDLLAIRARAGPAQTVGVSAGPFASTEALRRFEQSLRALPEVHAVTVREYEGADRVVVDVHLAPPTP